MPDFGEIRRRCALRPGHDLALGIAIGVAPGAAPAPPSALL